MVMKMKVAKIKVKKYNEPKRVEETYSLKNMIKILSCILIVFAIFYLITNLIVNNKKSDSQDNVTVVDFSKITLSQLLNREDDEYFVLATMASLYNSSYVDTNYITLYNEHINNYKQKVKDIDIFKHLGLGEGLTANLVRQTGESSTGESRTAIFADRLTFQHHGTGIDHEIQLINQFDVGIKSQTTANAVFFRLQAALKYSMKFFFLLCIDWRGKE